MTRYLLASVLASASLTSLFACDDSPPRSTTTEPRPVANDDNVPFSPAPAEPEQSPATVEGATPPQLARTCAPNTSMPLGNSYAALTCLPHLDAIGYWQSAREWATYDDVPVTVAVLDLSFLTEHPDIAGAIDMTWNFMEADCTSFDLAKGGCRKVAPLVPNPPPPPTAGEEPMILIHGTMIAGIIAGRGVPGEGVVGVNPSAKLDLFVRDVNTDNLSALRFAIQRHVDIISMSWPLGAMVGNKDVPEFKELLETATEQGIVVVTAAGNSRIDVDRQPVYPTRYSSIPGVIAVGSIDANGDLFTEFSNYGPSYVDSRRAGDGSLGGRRLPARTLQRADWDVVLGPDGRGRCLSRHPVPEAEERELHRRRHRASRRRGIEGRARSSRRFFKEGRQLDMTSLLAHMKTTVP